MNTDTTVKDTEEDRPNTGSLVEESSSQPRAPNNTSSEAEAVALFRYSIIGPMINGSLEESLTDYARRMSKIEFQVPGSDKGKYFSASTIMRWAQEYKREGYTALYPKQRSDRGKVRNFDEKTQQRIVELRTQFPQMNCVVMREMLIHEGFITDHVCVRSLQRYVANMRQVNPVPGEIKDRKMFQAPCAGSLWQADTKYYPAIMVEGKLRKLYLITIIDDYSRLVVGAGLYYEDNTLNLLEVFYDAICHYGVPDRIYVDHGPNYASKEMDKTCMRLGTVHIYAPVRDGASKGKVERVHGTLEQRAIFAVDVSKIHSREQYTNEVLIPEVNRYNTTVHSVTHERPDERYRKDLAHVTRPRSEAWLKDCFERREYRKVRRDNTIVIDNKYYDVPAQFSGQKVEIRFPLDRPDEPSLLADGKRIVLSRTDPVKNGRTKRSKSPRIDYGKEVSKPHDDGILRPEDEPF